MNTRPAVTLVLALGTGLAARPAIAQDADRGFAESILGTWTGEGTVTGAEVTLDRVWTRELGGRFLRAEMAVHMSNSFSFGAVTYWRQVASGAWEIRWMDEAGETSDYRGSWDPASRTVTTYSLEDTADEAPGWRRIRYRIVDDRHYEETLDLETPEGWTRIGEFRFTRTAGAGDRAAPDRGGAGRDAGATRQAEGAAREAETAIEAASLAFAAAQRALDGEAAAAFLAPDFYMYVDGTRLAYDEVAAGIANTMSSLRSLETKWSDLEVHALGPDAGYATFRFRDTVVTAAGETSVQTGPTTLVWARRGGEWRIVYADADHYPPE